MKNEQATLNLNNFLSSYTLQESTELLNQVYDQVTEGMHYLTLDDKRKVQLLDFLEALEELLQAIQEVHKQR